MSDGPDPGNADRHSEGKWAIRIAGHEFDIRFLEATFSETDVLHVQKINHQGTLRPYILSPRLDSISSSDEAYKESCRLVDLANAALRAHGQQPVALDALRETGANGKFTHYVFASANVTIRSDMVVSTGTIGSTDALSIPSAAAELVRKALSNPVLGEATSLLGKAENWVDLYNIFELLAKECGGEKKLELLIGRERRTRFTQTAQIERHRDKEYERAMTLSEGRTFITDAIHRIYDYRTAATDVQPSISR